MSSFRDERENNNFIIVAVLMIIAVNLLLWGVFNLGVYLGQLEKKSKTNTEQNLNNK